MNDNGMGVEIFSQMENQRLMQIRELEEHVQELRSEVESIQHTRKLYMKEHGIPELPQTPLLDHNLSLTKRRAKALIEWAERNGGILIVKEAKRALIAAGLVKPGRGAGWILYGTIANMDCWEKVEPGKYRLTSELVTDEFGHVVGRVTLR